MLSYLLFEHVYDSARLKPNSTYALRLIQRIRQNHDNMQKATPGEMFAFIATAHHLIDRLREELQIRRERNKRTPRHYFSPGIVAHIDGAGQLRARRAIDRLDGPVKIETLIYCLAYRGAEHKRRESQ